MLQVIAKVSIAVSNSERRKVAAKLSGQLLDWDDGGFVERHQKKIKKGKKNRRKVD